MRKQIWKFDEEKLDEIILKYPSITTREAFGMLGLEVLHHKATGGEPGKHMPLGTATRAVRASKLKQGLIEAKHGLRSTYQLGCTCAECTNANTEHQAEYRRMKKAGVL